MTATRRGYADPGWNLVALLRALNVPETRSWRVVHLPIEGRDQVSVYFRRSLVGSIDTALLPAAPLAQAATMLSAMSTWERTWSTPLAQRLLCPAVDGNLMVAEVRAGRIVLACPESPHRPVETVDLQLGRRAGRWPARQRHPRPSRAEVAVRR